MIIYTIIHANFSIYQRPAQITIRKYAIEHARFIHN